MVSPLIAVGLALLLTIGVAPGSGTPAGFDEALWLEGRRAYGEAGGTGCAVCHGDYGANELGLAPVVRGIDAERIHASFVTMETMTFLQGAVSDAEVEAMAYYLAQLGTMQPAIVTRRRGALAPAELRLPADTHVQLILVNGDRGTCTWTTSGAAAPTVVPGRATGATDWRTSTAGASLEAYCEEEPAMRVQLRIE